MSIVKKLVSNFENLDFSTRKTDKIGKKSLKYHVNDDNFSTIISIEIESGINQINLNLKKPFPLGSLIKELGGYSNYYNFRDNETELRFNHKIKDKNISVFIDGKVNSIFNGNVNIATPKGERKDYSPYLVDCLTIS